MEIGGMQQGGRPENCRETRSIKEDSDSNSKNVVPLFSLFVLLGAVRARGLNDKTTFSHLRDES
jgi:hypothetical protein